VCDSNRFKIEEDDESYMNPNLHPDDQDELEIPESKLYVGMR